MKIRKEEKLFRTNCFFTASVLSYFGSVLEGIERTNPDRLILCFLRNEMMDEVLDKLHKNQLSVEPQKFANIQKNLKARMFSTIN